MAIVNKINIANSQIINYDDFAKCFTDIITIETEDCGEFRVVYDRYDSPSLKNNTRSNRKKNFLLCIIKFLILPEYHIFKRGSSFGQLKQKMN